MKRVALGLLWLVAALPGLNQLRLLAVAIAGRVGYGYDLEWMEGGMLHHALRIQQGRGIYVAPSIDFIPYLYTPLYPGLLALFGHLFGLTYTLGRMVSVVSLVGIAVVAAFSLCSRRNQLLGRGEAWAGLALGLGAFAAAYPYCEGWYDLVRADTLFLALVTSGIAGIARWSITGVGWRGHARVAAGAAIFVLAFFTKQTGFVYVGFGGLVVLVSSWRRAFAYTLAAGVLALGLVAVFDATSDGWFWTYASKIHRAHDFSWDRFRDSFGLILGHFPYLTGTTGIALVVALVTRVRRGRLPPQVQPLLLWSAAFAVSTVVGAIGFGTEWAVYNAFMPAFLHGGLAAGASVAAMAACARMWWPRSAGRAAVIAAVIAAAPLAVQLARVTWDPQAYIPAQRDTLAGDKLIAQIRAIDGDVWMPSHPWYAYLAGKLPHVHRMGLKDVTRRQLRDLGGVVAAVKAHAFAAIVFDNNDLDTEGQEELQVLRGAITSAYRPAFKLPKDERPKTYNGGRVTPAELWVPALAAAPPAGAHVAFDFERAAWAQAGWLQSGAAWGPGPVTEVPNLAVFGATGHRFASSAGAGDDATGRVTSPDFILDGARLTLMLAGGTDASKLRVELWVDDRIERTASVPVPGGENLQRVSLPLGDLRGKTGKLVLVDEAIGGHLHVDDVWLWDSP